MNPGDTGLMTHETLTFRFDTADEPHGRAELARLILDVFGIDVTPLDRLGHDPSVKTFGYWDGDSLIGNVSLYERRLRLMGRDVAAFGVQSVAVRPEWRRRGLFGDLMRRALTYADARAELVILGTATPEVYRGFGFRDVVESCFSGPLTVGGASPDARKLSLDVDADVALLHDLFARRAPVSDIGGASDHPALFLLRAVHHSEIALYHLPGLDALVAVEDDDPQVFKLLDVIAPAIPSLGAMASALGSAATRAEVYLTPDKLGWVPASHAVEDTGYMVRGPYMPEGLPFMLTSMVI